MRPALYLCLVISVFHRVIHCDHHKDHIGKDNGEHHDHNGKDHHVHKHPENENVACPKIAAVNTEFAFRLYKQIIQSGNSDNVFFSPVSISTAFAMLSLGAGSSTFIEIVEGLGFNLTEIPAEDMHAGFHHLHHALNAPNSELQLSTGNALFIQKDLKILPKFTEDVQNYYDSEAFSTDFNKADEAMKQINDYIEKKTQGKIEKLLESLDESTIMVLTNYIFFKGKWEKVFDSNLTNNASFIVDENTTVTVPMMEREDTYYTWRDGDIHCTVVRLHYAGNASAFFILPDEGKMKEVEEGLSAATLEKWGHSTRERTFTLYIPKFSISATCDLKEVLEKIGITEVFSDMANLSGITGHNNLKVSKAVHKAVLSIDEQGTEAAGATAMELRPRFIPRPVIFDRPFLLLLTDKRTHSILFMGKINNPTKV